MNINPVTLIYFSPTQTTRKVLEAIAQGLNADAVRHINLTQMKARTGRTREMRGGLTLIGVPVYTGRVALEAVRGLQRVTAKDAPAIIIVVYGNRAYEDALLELRDIAAESGFTPVAGAAFIGEHSFSSEITPIAFGRPDSADLAHARAFGKTVRERMKKIRSLDRIQPLMVPGHIPYRDRNLSVRGSPDTREELCTKCRNCAKVCPVAAITVQEETVSTDTEKCILCCACVRGCPRGARVLQDPRFAELAATLSGACSERKEPELFM